MAILFSDVNDMIENTPVVNNSILIVIADTLKLLIVAGKTRNLTMQCKHTLTICAQALTAKAENRTSGDGV